MAVPDPKELPPLGSLRTFAIAARHANFTRSAEELGLTQGAVSHQIKLLEDHLGLRLFHRLPRKTVLTRDGRRLAETLDVAFRQILEAIDEVRRAQGSSLLIVNALPGFAFKWLFPRLIRFDEQYPEINVQIHTNPQLPDFAAGEAHLSIRYGLDDYPGLEVERFLEDQMFPVCSPALAAGEPPLTGPEDLSRHVLLHDDIQRFGGLAPGWAYWLEAAGAGNFENALGAIDPGRGRRYGQSNITLQAAIEGRGVALGRSALVALDLAEGRLVRPFGPAIPSGYAYYLVSPREAADHRKVQAFKAWLREEVAVD